MPLSPSVLGIIIGGLIPAVFFGLASLFSKASVQSGIGSGIYLMISGLAIVVVGIVVHFFVPDRTLSLRSGFHAIAVGVTYGIAAACIVIAMARFKTPLSQLVPLFNMNTLVSVLLALWIFAEWQQVKVLQLLFGAFLIVVGGILVSLA